MKIVIADGLPQSAVDILRAEGWMIDARTGRAPDALAADLADADALVVRSATKVTAPLLAGAPMLRIIARAGTGVDNVDLDAASARGILVINAPGANSISVAELACAFMLSAARSIALADAQLKQGRWEKKGLLGTELRGKTLGVVGLGRIGQAVARRAHAFEMDVVAHDPVISSHVAEDLGVELVSLDELCARADFITLHAPSTPATRGMFGRERLARCKKGVRIINTARGDLIDEAALADAIRSGQVAGAGLDVFNQEPPKDGQLTSLAQVVATPHIAASTKEAQELVGVETVTCVRDFLKSGIVRNAVNFPSVAPEESKRLQPYIDLAQRLGTVLAQLAEGRIEALGIRYYGELGAGNNELLVGATLVGLFKTILSAGVTMVNARAVAAQRGIEIIESRSTRPRNFTSLISLKLQTSAGERWVEGAVFEHSGPRLVLIDGVAVEAPLDGPLLVIRNNDQPGVIGDVGTVLGRHGINIATFALGRSSGGAIGVVTLDLSTNGKPESPGVGDELLAEIRRIPAVRAVSFVRV